MGLSSTSYRACCPFCCPVSTSVLESFMQRGQIYQRCGSWFLRYWEPVFRDGLAERRRVSVKLAAVDSDYPNRRSVLVLADKVLAPLNSGRVQAESSLTVAVFIENHYLPYVKIGLRASTYKDYNDVFRVHLKRRLGDMRLRDFRTVHGQRMMRDISGIGHTSLLRVKSFLSGVFKHAKREGFIDSENPMRDVSVPGRPKKFKGPVYTMTEIEHISTAVFRKDLGASDVIAVAAFTGLRQSELRGLRWQDYDGEKLNVSRSVWRTHINETKTEASEASVPILPLLQQILNERRVRVKGEPEQYIFAGQRRGTPLNLANLARRVIIPACVEYSEEVEELVQFKGWHAFRRSLATNLMSCGVAPRIIQAILRHSDVTTTMNIYVQPPSAESREALDKIAQMLANV